MNALTKFKKPSLTREQERIIRHQVALECQTITRKYEVMQDICFVYALVDELGFGPQRAERIYKKSNGGSLGTLMKMTTGRR